MEGRHATSVRIGGIAIAEEKFGRDDNLDTAPGGVHCRRVSRISLMIPTATPPMATKFWLEVKSPPF